ncbi:MAG: LamG domain-containing protein [Limisphaerales bacterium]
MWTNAGCYGYAPIFNGLTWFKANSNGVFHSNLRSLTASCWLSMPTHRQFDMIAAVSDSAVSIPGTWCLYVFDEKKIGWVMQTTGGRVEARGGNVTLTNSGWHHIAGTYDGVTLTLYIDGLAVTNRPLTGSLTPNFLPFTIGTCANLNLGNVTNGIIDDFKLWNRGLSADEIFAEWKSKDKGIVSASVGGYSVTNIFSVLTSLSFGAISPASESTVALTIQNLKNTDSVTATPTNFPPAGVIFVAWPSNNTAFVRARNFSTNSVDPSGYFRLSVIQ